MAQTGEGAADTPVIPGYSGLTLISRGSTAKVYKATQDRLNRLVAIKVLRVDDVLTTAAQVEQEFATTVALSAMPHIVSIIDTGTTDAGRPYIVMEYCEDGSYGHILVANGPLPVAEVVDVGIKVAEALQAAHQVRIIHRDVKPHNILRSRYGPALTDFGIARATDDLSGTITLNKLTPQHASPEALRREAQGPASDIYSLASTMWNLLAGYPPFADPGDNSPDPFIYRDRVLRDPLPPMRRADVPLWLQEELIRAMSKLAGERHGSAAEFADALRRGWARETGELWTPPSTYPPLGPGTEAQRVPSGMTGNGRSTGFGDPHTQYSSSARPVSASPISASPFSIPSVPTPLSPISGTPASGAPVSGTPAGFPTSAPPAFGGFAPAFEQPAFGPTAPSEHTPPAPPWMAQPQPPVSAPPQPPAPDEPRSRWLAIWPYLAAAVVGIVIGVGVLVALRSGSSNHAAPSTGTSSAASPTLSPNATASDVPSIAPTGVTLADHQTWVELRWTDRTNGQALYFVVGSPVGTTAQKLSQPAHGTSRRIDGLRTDVDYCFNVMAMLSVDEVSASSRVCTSRGKTD